MSALRLSATIRPSMPSFLRIAANSDRRVATSLDRAVEVDIGDQPALAAAAHHVVDFDRLAVGFDDPAAHPDPGRGGFFAGHLQLLSAIAVEAVEHRSPRCN